MPSEDSDIRAAAFLWLANLTEAEGDTIPRALLATGFEFHGTRVPLVGPQGIFKPRIMDLPLSIAMVYGGPYADRIDDAAVIHYKYRGDDASHRDNVGLRTLMTRRTPLRLFVGVGNGRYDVLMPVFIESDNPMARTFTARVDDIGLLDETEESQISDDRVDARRRYLTVAARVRLHQRAFRERVLVAYDEQCAVCRLKHRELLDGAHLVEDSQGGPPTTPNGMSLCKLHHAAFDRHVVGIHPDKLVLEVRDDVLKEVDGPMLLHGLQELHGLRIHVPKRLRDQPSPEFLVPRYTRFRAA